MADYQSLLTRAVANLPPTSAPAARAAIYERARKALVTQLRSLRPPLPESDPPSIRRPPRDARGECVSCLNDSTSRATRQCSRMARGWRLLSIRGTQAACGELARPRSTAP